LAGTACPLWWRLAREKVVKGLVAADAEDLLDLSAGLARSP
jgi:hypothetical protein